MIKKYLSQMLADNDILELRHENDGIWVSGWFDNLNILLAEINRRKNIGNLYTSLNRPKIREVENRMHGNPIKNADVDCITRIPFDFDPTRPTGMPSTKTELIRAYDLRMHVVGFLNSLGWGIPLLAMSGNGYHAQYRTRLNNDAETAEMFRVIYLWLHSIFDSDSVSFDSSVKNPGRIFRLYGTTNRKGQNSAERPYRTSKVKFPPGRWVQIRPSQIETLAISIERGSPDKHAVHQKTNLKPTGSGDYSTLDVVSWFSAHGYYKRPLEGGKHAVVCPWSNSHTTPDVPHGTDTVIWQGSGNWPTFHCSHAHCCGRSISEVMSEWGDQDEFCSEEFSKAVAS